MADGEGKVLVGEASAMRVGEMRPVTAFERDRFFDCGLKSTGGFSVWLVVAGESSVRGVVTGPVFEGDMDRARSVCQTLVAARHCIRGRSYSYPNVLLVARSCLLKTPHPSVVKLRLSHLCL